jgi:hypothetical protein
MDLTSENLTTKVVIPEWSEAQLSALKQRFLKDLVQDPLGSMSSVASEESSFDGQESDALSN